jgi:hypothetical protein
MGIGVFAGIDTFFAADAPADIDQRGQGFFVVTGPGKGRTGTGNCGAGRKNR